MFRISSILFVITIIISACSPLGLMTEETQVTADQAENQATLSSEPAENQPTAFVEQTATPSAQQQEVQDWELLEPWPYETGGPPAPQGFTVQAYDEFSIRLAWQSVPGAERYLLERRIGESGFLILSEIPGDTTEVLDYLAPQGETSTYQLRSLAGNNAGETVEASTQLPSVSIDPLIVSIIPFDTSFSFDPNDISSLFSMGDEEGEESSVEELDPDSIDFSSLFGGLQSSGVLVGPDGGRLTASSPDGLTTYVLDIPAGALLYEIELTLVPVETIDGMPFSGGLLGAVEIQPTGVVFDIPAVLSIENTDGQPDDGLLSIGFAVDGETSELYLYPFADPSAASAFSGAPGLASLARVPAQQVRPKIFTVKQSQTIGHSRGTPAEINRQVKRGASSAVHQQMQRSAASEMADDLAPITPVKNSVLAEWGDRLRTEMIGMMSMGELTNSLYSLQAWLEEVAKERRKSGQQDKFKGREAEFWALSIENINIEISLIAEKCKNSDSQVDPADVLSAKSIMEKLISSKKGFWRQLADQYTAKYGSESLQQLKKKLDECVFVYNLPETQIGDITLKGDFCPDRPFSLEIGGSYAVGAYNFTPTKANQGVLSYYGTGIDSPWSMNGTGTWKLLGAGAGNAQLMFCDFGKVDVGGSGGGCQTLDLFITNQKCGPQ